MAQNQSPIFGLVPHVSGITSGTSANTNKDGTGTVATVFTAGANGSKIERVFMQHLGTNVGTVIRVFLNNGSTNTIAANNYLIHEEAFGAWSNSEVAVSTSKIWYANLIVPAGYKINITTATAIASGIMCTAEGSDF